MNFQLKMSSILLQLLNKKIKVKKNNERFRPKKWKPRVFLQIIEQQKKF